MKKKLTLRKLMDMKKMVLASFFSLCCLMIFAQQNQNRQDRNRNQSQAPASVQQAWQRDHGNEGNPQWNQTNGQWHGRYQDKTNNKNVDTYYNQKGYQIDTHRQLNQNELPAQYKHNINKRYQSNGNYDVTRIERPNQKEVYQLRMKNKGRNKTVYTDQHGSEIKYRDTHRD